MDRHRHAVDAGRQDIAGRIAAEHGHVALLEPAGARCVQPGEFSVPRAHRRATCPATGADQDDVAGADAGPGLLFPRVEVFGMDRRAGLQVREAAEPRDVDQHAAGDDALFQVLDAQFRRAGGGDLRLREAVVHPARVEHVAQAVDVRVRQAVVRDLVGVGHGEAGVVRPRPVDHVEERRTVVHRLLLLDVAGEGDRHPGTDQRHRRLALGRRHEVERAELVVGSPAAPVRELDQGLLEVRTAPSRGGPRRVLSGRGGRSAGEHPCQADGAHGAAGPEEARDHACQPRR